MTRSAGGMGLAFLPCMELSTAGLPRHEEAPQGAPAKAKLWQDDDLSFGDVLDAINPLHHIPILGTIYRAITGDALGHVPRLVGGAIFGGPIGFLASVVSVGLKDQTGSDPGEYALAMIDGSAAQPASATVLAEAEPPAPSSAEKLAGAIDVRLDQIASTPAAATVQDAAPEAAVAPPKPEAAVRPDHPPMPLNRTSVTAARNDPVPLQTATLVPRPRALGMAGNVAEVPRQMMDALDKYARMQVARGARVDLSH